MIIKDQSMEAVKHQLNLKKENFNSREDLIITIVDILNINNNNKLNKFQH